MSQPDPDWHISSIPSCCRGLDVMERLDEQHMSKRIL